jgi:hypothetical protein
VLTAATVYCGYEFWKSGLRHVPTYAPFLGLGWIVCYLFYLLLIGSIRGCITESMDRVRSPLDM